MEITAFVLVDLFPVNRPLVGKTRVGKFHTQYPLFGGLNAQVSERAIFPGISRPAVRQYHVITTSDRMEQNSRQFDYVMAFSFDPRSTTANGRSYTTSLKGAK